MMDKDTYIEIAGKIADGTASEREIELYNAYFNAYQLKYPSWNELGELQRKEMTDEAEEGIHVQLRHNDDRKSVRLWPRIAVAAAAVAAIVFGVWFFNSRYDMNVEPGTEVAKVNDIAPGKNGATITLANGKVIQLSDAKTGVVVGSDLKYNDGAAVQGGDPDLRQDDVMQLTASTAKGQTYQFTLPDGTKVWLNADSKISFPSQFSGKERKILLDGEGYFEVAKDKVHPFKVATDKQEVEVLGTHFNINAYKDESNTRTTLLEGSVSVRHAEFISASRNSRVGGPDLRQDDVVLKPNQQSVLTGSNQIKVTDVDVDEVLSWKSGKFSFASEEIGNIMKQISRWYDVDVNYTDDVQKIRISGSVSRFANISVLLQKLEQTGLVHFRVEGRKIIVSKEK
jgi:transmembrane sensor